MLENYLVIAFQNTQLEKPFLAVLIGVALLLLIGGAFIVPKFIKKRKIERVKQFASKVIKSQTDFASKCRHILTDTLHSYGYYYYDATVKFQESDFSETRKFRVWQPFKTSFCNDDSISYEYCPELKERRSNNAVLKSAEGFFVESVYDQILFFIEKLQKDLDFICVVVFVNTECISSGAMQKHYGYLKGQLSELDIKYYDFKSFDKLSGQNVCYIIIDLITRNNNLKSVCSQIMQARCDLKTVRDRERLTNIVFLSLVKQYDAEEVNELSEKKLKKIREEEEQKRKDERDIIKAKEIALSCQIGFSRFFEDLSAYNLNAGQARSIISKESSIIDYNNLVSRLKNSVNTWKTVEGIPHYFFYYYYPTRFIDVSEASCSARSLIYNFKNGMSHDNVKELVKTKITTTFNSVDISKLTFVCIPASTRAVNKSRYEDFSREICEELGMRNAYDKITITKDKTPFHLGGNDCGEYAYDCVFFKNALVVLFDDVVTRGHSISSQKSQLESLGATVICAISIGKTYSDWTGSPRSPHPYTETM